MNCETQKWYNLGLLDSPQASLIIPDFTISVYGSSCNSLFLVSFSLHAFSAYILAHWSWRCLFIDRERKEEKMRLKKRELHELPYTEIVKSGIIRLSLTVFARSCKGRRCFSIFANKLHLTRPKIFSVLDSVLIVFSHL